MRLVRGIDVAVRCRDDAERLLLVPAAGGRWTLPGGEVRHGQHPAQAAARVLGALAAPTPVLGPALGVVTDIAQSADGWVHRDVILYAGRAQGPGTAGHASSTLANQEGSVWFAEPELASLTLMPATASSLTLRSDGMPGNDQPGLTPPATVRVAWSEVPEPVTGRQRFAAYGFVTDPAGRILLTLIADGFPGAGRWHLPGGGTDFGESAGAALHREILEETGQYGRIEALLSVSHRFPAGGPGGARPAWHAVRVIYAVRVPDPTSPQVQEVGGSTAAAAWYPPAQVAALSLTDAAIEALRAGAR